MALTKAEFHEGKRKHPGGSLPWPFYRRSPDQAMTQETTLHSEKKGGGEETEMPMCVHGRKGMHGHGGQRR